MQYHCGTGLMTGRCSQETEVSNLVPREQCSETWEKSDLANVRVHLEWLEGSQCPGRDTEDRIPSCLAIHKALFLACQLGKVLLQLAPSLPLCCIDFKIHTSSEKKSCSHVYGACEKTCKGLCQLSHFCVDAHGTEDMCGMSSSMKLPNRIEKTNMRWREWVQHHVGAVWGWNGNWRVLSCNGRHWD